MSCGSTTRKEKMIRPARKCKPRGKGVGQGTKAGLLLHDPKAGNAT